ncbi:uncharacterized protein LOC135200632 [Macrobrachium nipponense]|uniref:uncharacterized protein LOC135200632 n=1 Tax=Macrobrachium nipponense TaxID=159736 RepID=UPI0030C89217
MAPCNSASQRPAVAKGNNRLHSINNDFWRTIIQDPRNTLPRTSGELFPPRTSGGFPRTAPSSEDPPRTLDPPGSSEDPGDSEDPPRTLRGTLENLQGPLDPSPEDPPRTLETPRISRGPSEDPGEPWKTPGGTPPTRTPRGIHPLRRPPENHLKDTPPSRPRGTPFEDLPEGSSYGIPKAPKAPQRNTDLPPSTPRIHPTSRAVPPPQPPPTQINHELQHRR